MQKKIYTERQLLQMAATGDESAFAELFHLYKHRLYSYLLRLSGSPELAEDTIQEVFLQLWENRDSLGKIEHFAAYIFRMAQHRVLNIFKRTARETLILAELRKQPSLTLATAEENLSLGETRQQLRRAFDKLSPRQKLIYTLSRDKGLQHEEIARRLRISRSTVNNHLILALRTLRAHLGRVTTLFLSISIYFRL